MPKPNYQFEKRQRELARKKEQEEKLARKKAVRAAAEAAALKAPESVSEQDARGG